MLEFHCGEDKSVPTKIFVAANKKFDTDPDFVCRYLSYLLSIGDEQSACLIEFTTRANLTFWQTPGPYSKYQHRRYLQIRRGRYGSGGRGMSTSTAI